MTDYDEKIYAGLSVSDEEFLKDLEDGRGIFTQLGSLFRGPMAYMSYVIFIFILIFTALMIYCGWRAIIADDVRMTVLWCTGTLASLFPHGLMRIWLLGRMNHLMVLRELKKLELQIARLSEK